MAMWKCLEPAKNKGNKLALLNIQSIVCFSVCTDDTLTIRMHHIAASVYHTSPPGGGAAQQLWCSSKQIFYSGYMKHRPRHQPTSVSTHTCRRLSPTTGPLPTVHCWQSTMHCPDSAKLGKSLALVHVRDPQGWTGVNN